MTLLYLPFVLQASLMGIDEYLHVKRGLGWWERLGHPLDTLTVLVPFLFISNNPYSRAGLYLYTGLAIFSCLFITKDEFIHKKECGLIESWLHALLFILHPLLFMSGAILWMFHPHEKALQILPLVMGVFFIYQVLRWSVPWKRPVK